MTRTRKIAVVGAGSVGTAIAYAALIQGVAEEVALFDLDAPKATAEMLDLRHGLQFVGSAKVTAAADVTVCADADVVVVTAGAKQRPGQSRLELAEANVALARALAPQLAEVAPDAVQLYVTNPVDVVTFAAQQALGDRGHLAIGSGTVLDTSRLRQLVAERLGVAVSSVHATIVGEHGDSEIALWSTADVGGVPITDVVGVDGQGIGLDELDGLLDDVRHAAYRIIEGKGATNLAIGLATTRILVAVTTDERAVLPISTRHDVDGVGEVCLSLPTIVGHRGAHGVLDVPLSDAERDGLRQSAAAIRAAIDATT